MTLLGLDLGTSCGWCVLRVGDDVLRKGEGVRRLGSGTWDLAPGRSGPWKRWSLFRDQLEGVLTGQVTHVAYENVHRHLGTEAAHVYGGLVAGMQLAAHDAGLGAPLGLEVSHVKRRATGKGNATKDAMVEAARPLLGRAPITDDEADALFVALLGIDTLRQQKGVYKEPVL